MTKPIAIYYNILNYQKENIDLLHDYFDVIELINPLDDTDDVLSKSDVLFAPLGFKVTEDKINKAPNLKVIISNTTGVPHIDMAYAKKAGVAVCALHNEADFLDTITPTAEHTIGLMMAAHRRIPAAFDDVKSGIWNRRDWPSPKMLSRMSLGIVGYGRIGKKVGNIASSLGMKVDYFDPYVTDGDTSLISLAQKSDVLTIHAPANDETKNLISRDVIYSLPENSILINTARGELLDTDALIERLEEGWLWAAALDTIDGEYEVGFDISVSQKRVFNYSLKKNNLILSPHIGGSTLDAWFETENFVIKKAISVLEEK